MLRILKDVKDFSIDNLRKISNLPKIYTTFLYIFLIVFITEIKAQQLPTLQQLPSLPDQEGFAGMFAGVSKGELFCMGGANFPEKRPWEGGKKKWYPNIYRLENGEKWVELPQKMPAPLAYGVTISYQDKMIVLGGSDEAKHNTKAYTYEWAGSDFKINPFPDLPEPLANMAGALVKNLIIVAGGGHSLTTSGVKKAYAFDLDNPKKGWFKLPSPPGRERNQPICAVYKDTFYLFSGEAAGVGNQGEKFRYILQDAYAFSPVKKGSKWTGTWKPLAPMPKGTSAAGTPLPVLKNGHIVFWGGVDAVTALHKDPSTHKGINQDVLLYNIEKDTWIFASKITDIPARVTLPVVFWNNQWVYISGEIKPGVRTNTVYSIKD